MSKEATRLKLWEFLTYAFGTKGRSTVYIFYSEDEADPYAKLYPHTDMYDGGLFAVYSSDIRPERLFAEDVCNMTVQYYMALDKDVFLAYATKGDE